MVVLHKSILLLQFFVNYPSLRSLLCSLRIPLGARAKRV